MTPHFTKTELGCNHCGLAQFHPGFLDKLEELRVAMAMPMTINSACRCSQHNANIKGHVKSLHVGDREMHPGQQGSLAVDVATSDPYYRGKLFATAWRLGWSIGWNGPSKFLHLDRRDMVGLSQTTFDY